MRCYVPNIDVNLSTKTAVHEALYDKLAGAGITIAFPQHDVHLDLSGPLDVRVGETEAVQRQRKSQERSPWRRTRR